MAMAEGGTGSGEPAGRSFPFSDGRGSSAQNQILASRSGPIGKLNVDLGWERARPSMPTI
jgi:hypothetical protein